MSIALAEGRPLTRGRIAKDRVFTGMAWMAFLVVALALGAVLGFVIVKGAPVVNWQFLTTSPIQIPTKVTTIRKMKTRGLTGRPPSSPSAPSS